MRLVPGIAAGAKLLEGHHQLDRVEHPHDTRELRGGQPSAEANELVARHVDVDEHPGEPLVGERHRLRGDIEVEPMRDEETVDHVELRGVLAVEAENDAVPHHELRVGIRRPVGGDEAELGHGSTSVSRRSSVASRAAKRPLRRASAIRREPSCLVRGDGLPHEGRIPRRPERLESHRPGLELGRGRPPGPERGVDREQLVVGNGGQLGGALEAVGELGAARRPGDRRLQPERGRGGARVVCRQPPLTRRGERDVVEREPRVRLDEIGPARAERVVGDGVESHAERLG